MTRVEALDRITPIIPGSTVYHIDSEGLNEDEMLEIMQILSKAIEEVERKSSVEYKYDD